MLKNKKTWVVLFCGLFIILISGCTSTTNGDNQDEIELQVVTVLNSQHSIWEGTMEPWMEKVEDLTDNRVTFETFTSEELVDVDEEVSALKNGTADIAIIHPTYYPDQFPLMEVPMLPLTDGDVETASQAWRDMLDSDEEIDNGKTFYELQVDDNDLFALPLTTTWEYSLSTTGQEFNTVDDIEGLSVRSPSSIHEIIGRELGLNTTSIAGSEVYEALSRGTVDGTFNGVADWSGWNYQDVLRYTLTGIDFGYFPFMIGMSKERWNELPEDIQNAMIEAHDEVYEEGIQEWFARVDPIIEDNEEQGGKFENFEDLNPEVQEKLEEATKEGWIEYTKKLEEDGEPGKKVVKLWLELIKKHGGKVPEGVTEELE